MNNLGTLNNQFHFNLPLDFIPEDLEERYMKLLGAKRKLFASTLDYLNSTIQTITFPGVNFPIVSNPQIIKRKQIKWKTVGNVYDLFDSSITVTFFNVDSNINYIIMQDLLIHHYLNVEKAYDEGLMITVLDENRMGLYTIAYRDVMWTGISDNTFGFNDQTISNKTFTCTFTFNFIDYNYFPGGIDIITKDPSGGTLSSGTI